MATLSLKSEILRCCPLLPRVFSLFLGFQTGFTVCWCTCILSYCPLASLYFDLASLFCICGLLKLFCICAPAKAVTNINQFSESAYNERISVLGPSLKLFWIVDLTPDSGVSLRLNHVYQFETYSWLTLISKKWCFPCEHRSHLYVGPLSLQNWGEKLIVCSIDRMFTNIEEEQLLWGMLKLYF